MGNKIAIGARPLIPHPENKILVSLNSPEYLEANTTYLLIVDLDQKTAEVGVKFEK